jgi:hypothetical protein
MKSLRCHLEQKAKNPREEATKLERFAGFSLKLGTALGGFNIPQEERLR